MSDRSDTFTCAKCGGMFDKAWSDAEAKALFGEVDDPVELSEQCWQAFMACYATQN